MSTMICGKSGRGTTRVIVGGTYYPLYNFADPLIWGPEVYEDKPKQPAWTQMNNDWRKKK